MKESYKKKFLNIPEMFLEWLILNAPVWILVYGGLLNQLALLNLIISNMGADYYTFWNTWVIIWALASFWLVKDV